MSGNGWTCVCGKHFRHQSNYSRHVHGVPAEGRKPCSVVKGGTGPPSWLHAHQAVNQFPAFMPKLRIMEILTGRTEEVPLKLLREIHLRPHDREARSQCNVYWANVNRSDVMVFDGERWVVHKFYDWFRSFCRWIFRSWDPDLVDQREAFIRFYTREDLQWKEVEKSARSTLLGATRGSVKKLVGRR